MRPVSRARDRAPALDWLRAGAAGLVLLSHARALLIQDAPATAGTTWPAAIFYGLSGLGHQAVIVFFVLSGLLVTDAMLRLAEREARWLGPFAVARLTRLWIVLVPCLGLGALLDRLGIGLVGAAQPYGIAPLAHHATTVPTLGLDVAIGNLMFLQTIAVPVLGSNGPLWSLANEAWYYGLAALVFTAWRTRRRPARLVASLAILLCFGLLLPIAITQLAPVWACGAVVAVLRRAAPQIVTAWRGPFAWGGGLLVGPALLAARLHWGPEPLLDLGLGLALAALLLSGLARGRAGGGSAPARCLADMSYSLYLSHLPVLALVAALTVGPARLPPGAHAIWLLGLALILALGVGWAVWWCFERHTERLRSWLARHLSGPRLDAAPRVVAP